MQTREMVQRLLTGFGAIVTSIVDTTTIERELLAS